MQMSELEDKLLEGRESLYPYLPLYDPKYADSSRRWRGENLDSFFTIMYQYYVFKGLGVVIVSQLCAVLNLAFSIAFSSFLLGFVDFEALGRDCAVTNASEQCGPSQKYVRWMDRRVILAYIVLSCFYLCWRMFSAFVLVSHSAEMEAFFRDKLHISPAELSGHALQGGEMTWDEVLQRLMVADAREGGGGTSFDLWQGAPFPEPQNCPTISVMNMNHETNTEMKPRPRSNTDTDVYTNKNVNNVPPSKGQFSYSSANAGVGASANAIPSMSMSAIPLEQRVAMRIMRKENFLVAMVNEGAVDLSCPKALHWLGAGGSVSGTTTEGPAGTKAGSIETNNTNTKGRPQELSQALEWSLDWCLLKPLFTRTPPLLDTFSDGAISGLGGGNRSLYARNTQLDMTVGPSCPLADPLFLSDTAGLSRRLRLCALILVLGAPFLLVFKTAHFFLSSCSGFHLSGAYLGPRQWTPLALWRFREFNELPHVHSSRMQAGREAATEFVDSFPRHPQYLALCRCVSFVCGAVLSALLLLSVVEEGVLLHLHVLEHNLLWFLGVLTAVYTACVTYDKEEERRLALSRGGEGVASGTAVSGGRGALLRLTCLQTHYACPHWAEPGATDARKGDWSSSGGVGVTARPRPLSAEGAVRAELRGLLPHKLTLFLRELASIVIAPAVLLRLSADEGCRGALRFLQRRTMWVPGLGDVLDSSLLDPHSHPSMGLGAPAADISMGQGRGEEREQEQELPYAGDSSRGHTQSPASPTYPTWRKPTSQYQQGQGQGQNQLKLHQSLLSFSGAHPYWRPLSPSGSDLLTHIRSVGPSTDEEAATGRNDGGVRGFDGFKSERRPYPFPRKRTDRIPPLTATATQATQDRLASPVESMHYGMLRSLLGHQNIDWRKDSYWRKLAGLGEGEGKSPFSVPSRGGSADGVSTFGGGQPPLGGSTNLHRYRTPLSASPGMSDSIPLPSPLQAQVQVQSQLPAPLARRPYSGRQMDSSTSSGSEGEGEEESEGMGETSSI